MNAKRKITVAIDSEVLNRAQQFCRDNSLDLGWLVEDEIRVAVRDAGADPDLVAYYRRTCAAGRAQLEG